MTSSTPNLLDTAKMSEKPKKKWIKKAVGKHKGLLHEHLGVAEGEKIPEDKLRGALHSGSKQIREEAQAARNMIHAGKHKKTKPTSEKIKAMYGSKH